MRDNKRDWQHSWYDKYNYAEKYEEKEYYALKDKLLEFATPVCIHTVTRTRCNKVFDWMDEYDECDVDADDIIGFVDRRGDYHTYYYVEHSFEEYYLYYEIGGYSFHHPVTKYIAKKTNLESIEIGDLTTEGKNIEDLLSVQFVKKVISGLENKTHKLAA